MPFCVNIPGCIHGVFSRTPSRPIFQRRRYAKYIWGGRRGSTANLAISSHKFGGQETDADGLGTVLAFFNLYAEASMDQRRLLRIELTISKLSCRGPMSLHACVHFHHRNYKRSTCACRSASYLGEYRTIMNLVRVLPNGREAKLVVDEAIDRCAPIGNLRDDIHR